jgi:hypothetical protein
MNENCENYENLRLTLRIFFPTFQFWITGDVYTLQADLIGFVNGLLLAYCLSKLTIQRSSFNYPPSSEDQKTKESVNSFQKSLWISEEN